MADDTDIQDAPQPPEEDAAAVTTGPADDGPSPLRQMMSQYFMEYASYVIKDRAIPELDDGLKPVQRRILHTLHTVDDGKFHKVAGIVGETMKYHPHGDQSIYNALVHLANREFFIDKQGNFGNLFTGDAASAARYIECRLSPLARETLFNTELTEFVPSYDGRNKEPVVIPAKVPVLLMQGAEGIAVGMATRVLPHNFRELIEAEIAALRDQSFRLFPDFFQGGIMDVGEYDDGNGKIRLRALIEEVDQKTLVIREIPAGTTTEGLITSIEDAARKGKVKIASIDDYTAETVNIEIKLPRGVYADTVIPALYAYSQCEQSISCNCLVIRNNRPEIMSVSAILKHNAETVMDILRRELELKLGKLEDQFHAKTLAQIFIENRIYKRIEECVTTEAIFTEVRAGLEPFLAQLRRPDVTDDDIEKLLQIPIRRISRFDINRNQRELDEILTQIDEVKKNLGQLKRYTIGYLKELLKRFGDFYPRRTRIENLEEVDRREVALQNIKVGLSRKDGFVGTSVRSDETVTCTEFDKIVIVRWDGTYVVMPIPEKEYVGSVCAMFRSDRDQVFSLIYKDKKSRICYAKRFKIESFIQNKEYRCCPKNAKIEKLWDRYGIVVRCEFEPAARQRVSETDVDFDQIELRSAGARGFKIHDKPIAKFLQLKRGSDTDPNVPDQPGAAVDDGDDEDLDVAAEFGVAQPSRDAAATIPAVRRITRDGTQKIIVGVSAEMLEQGLPAEKPKADKADPAGKPEKRFKIDEDHPFELDN